MDPKEYFSDERNLAGVKVHSGFKSTVAHTRPLMIKESLGSCLSDGAEGAEYHSNEDIAYKLVLRVCVFMRKEQMLEDMAGEYADIISNIEHFETVRSLIYFHNYNL